MSELVLSVSLPTQTALGLQEIARREDRKVGALARRLIVQAIDAMEGNEKKTVTVV